MIYFYKTRSNKCPIFFERHNFYLKYFYTIDGRNYFYPWWEEKRQAHYILNIIPKTRWKQDIDEYLLFYALEEEKAIESIVTRR